MTGKNDVACRKRPEGIRGRNLYTSHGQSRYGDRPRIKYGAGCVQIPVDDLLDIRTEKSIESFKTFLIGLGKGSK